MHRIPVRRLIDGAADASRAAPFVRGLFMGSALIVGLSCARPGEALIPNTPLGQTATEWLFAHNEGDGHAAVHFAARNRGERHSNGAEQDSAVLAAVQASRRIGRLTPIAIVASNDTMLVLRLRSDSAIVWVATFRPVPQPDVERVRVLVVRDSSRP